MGSTGSPGSKFQQRAGLFDAQLQSSILAKDWFSKQKILNALFLKKGCAQSFQQATSNCHGAPQANPAFAVQYSSACARSRKLHVCPRAVTCIAKILRFCINMPLRSRNDMNGGHQSHEIYISLVVEVEMVNRGKNQRQREVLQKEGCENVKEG